MTLRLYFVVLLDFTERSSSGLRWDWIVIGGLDKVIMGCCYSLSKVKHAEWWCLCCLPPAVLWLVDSPLWSIYIWGSSGANRCISDPSFPFICRRDLEGYFVFGSVVGFPVHMWTSRLQRCSSKQTWTDELSKTCLCYFLVIVIKYYILALFPLLCFCLCCW